MEPRDRRKHFPSALPSSRRGHAVKFCPRHESPRVPPHTGPQHSSLYLAADVKEPVVPMRSAHRSRCSASLRIAHTQVRTNWCARAGAHAQVHTRRCTRARAHAQVRTHRCTRARAHAQERTRRCARARAHAQVRTRRSTHTGAHAQVHTHRCEHRCARTGAHEQVL